jgi:CBS domain-containing protein
MTPDVVTLGEDVSSADIAATLVERGVTGVPIVDGYEVIVGIVTWTDVLRNIDFREDGQDRRQLNWRNAGHRAVDLMNAVPVTIGPDATLAAADRTMRRRSVSRLLVVDRRNRLLGIVTRRDLLKPFSRLDEVIEDDVKQQVLRRTLMVEPGAVQVRVDEGVATLTGQTARRTTALAAAALTAAIPGVVDVVDQLSFQDDDTVGVALAPIDPVDQVRGWWNPSVARSDDPAPPARRPTAHATSEST